MCLLRAFAASEAELGVTYFAGFPGIFYCAAVYVAAFNMLAIFEYVKFVALVGPVNEVEAIVEVFDDLCLLVDLLCIFLYG